MLLRTATPTFKPTTPEPTVTPLFRATEILLKDYGQHLTLFIGDKFILYRLAVDSGPLAIDNPAVLQVLTNPNNSSVTLQATGLGNVRVSSFITYLCPDVPHCEPPFDYTYVTVTVIAQ